MIDINAQRDSMLQKLPPVFREVDRAVASYIDLVMGHPDLDDADIMSLLQKSGIEDSLVDECVTFVPLAFGRVLVDSYGVSVADTYIKHDLGTGQSTECELAKEPAFIWAKSVTPLYHQSKKYKATFSRIASGSAEVSVICNALNSGITASQLGDSEIPPVSVNVGTPKRRWWQFW